MTIEAQYVGKITIKTMGLESMGVVESYTPPKMSWATDDVDVGGIIRKVRTRLEALEATIKVRKLQKMGTIQNAFLGNQAMFTIEMTISQDGALKKFTSVLKGSIRETDDGEFKHSEAISQTLVLDVNFYSKLVDDEEIALFDIDNEIFPTSHSFADSAVGDALTF